MNVMRWVAGGQIQGDRGYQEDDFSITPLTAAEGRPGEDRLLLVLADGMGGHTGGAVASGIVVQAFQEGFNQARAGIADQLEAGIETANEAVRMKQQSDPDLSEMGSTLIAALVIGPMLYWASVGDSILWLFRDGRLLRLNEDHSMRPLLLDLVNLGRMTEEEALGDSRLHQLRSAIFGEPLPLVDIAADGYPLEAGDLVLLASDGLETLSGEALTNAIKAGGSDAQEIVRVLLNGVAAAGVPGQDNTTALAYRVGRGNASLHGALADVDGSTGTAGSGQENDPAPADEDLSGQAGEAPAKRFGIFARIAHAIFGKGETDKDRAKTP